MPSTQNFEWNVEDLLGKGAFGSVYKVSVILFTIVALEEMQKQLKSLKN